MRALHGMLETIAAECSDLASVHGVALVEGAKISAAIGFNGLTLAAPIAIADRLAGAAPPSGAIVLSNDPHAGGVSLNHLFLVARTNAPACWLVAALTFADFGAMRSDVFRRRAETFHEGLSLSRLTADWGGTDRHIVLSVIGANVRRGEAVRAIIDKSARAVLAAAAERNTVGIAAGPSATLPRGAGRGSAPVTDGGELVVVAEWRGRSEPTLSNVCLKLVGGAANGQMARCSASSARSAVVLALADAFGARWQDLVAMKIDCGNVAATAPEAVGDGLPVAYACYRAAFAAARAAGAQAEAPRSLAAFTEKLAAD